MFDKYGEVINSVETYKKVAEKLFDKGRCIVGWTDQGYDHRDILFTYKPMQYGNLQRGLKWCYLYVSIMDFTCMGFLIELKTDNRKHNSYLKEKLRLDDNNCDDKICDLINGVIHALDVLEGNIDGSEEDESNREDIESKKD